MTDQSHPTSTHRGGSRTLALWILVLVVIAGAVAVVFAARPRAPRSTITVTGTGTVKGAPDTMTMNIGVQSVASSATAALRQNNTQMSRLEAALLAHGLTRAGLQTSDLQIYDNTDSNGRVTGFTVTDTLTATTHRLNEAGAALDAAATAVGNDVQLNGVSFSISSQSHLLSLARRVAVDHAASAAREIATASGTSIGQPVSIVDEETQSTPIVYGPTNFAAAKASVPIEQGNVSLTLQVKVVYALN